MGVEVKLKTGVAAVAADHIELKQGETVFSDPTSTVIWTAGVEGAEVVSRLKDLKLMGRKRLQTDEYLRAESRSDIYVAGDNIFHLPENQSMPVPQMVENAEQSAEVVAHNIVADITGKGMPKKYMPKFHGAMLSVGGRYGTAYIGTDKKKVALPSFPAMFVKHFINVVYFIQVAGWNKVIHYLKNEFFTIRHCRSFLGGHFSNRTPSFMLVAFRIWLGAVWAFEGAMKVAEGWLKEPKLEGFFGGASAWFEGILKAGGEAGVSEAVDAVSSATAAGGEAGASAGTILFDFDFLGFVRAVFVSGKPLAEILIGMSMMSGLLTTFSSLASIVLLFMFMSTTGLFLSSFWMLFGAVARRFGAGKVFGLDYYVSPLLKRSWSRIGWVKRLYLYHD
jgi:NADH dehydrogenase